MVVDSGKGLEKLYYSLISIKSHFDYVFPILTEKHKNSQDSINAKLLNENFIFSIKGFIKKYSLDDIDDYFELVESDNEVREEFEKIANEMMDTNFNNDKKSNLEFSALLNELRNTLTQIKYIRQNAVLNSIFSFENYISQLLIEVYKEYPMKIVENKTITISDIIEFENFEIAAEHLIHCEVESIMYGSLEKWFDKISNTISFKSSFYKENKVYLNEIYYRRNILVHNSGVVNSTYIKMSTNPYNLKIGEELDITDEYISQVTNYFLLCTAFDIFIETKLKKYCIDNSHNVSDLAQVSFLAFEILKNRWWKTSKFIYNKLRKIKGIDEARMKIYELNYYLSAYMLGDKEELALLEKLDYSGKSTFLRVGYYTLLEKFDDLERLINIASSSTDEKERIGSFELSTWPIFIKLRDNHSENYEKLLEICKNNE